MDHAKSKQGNDKVGKEILQRTQVTISNMEREKKMKKIQKLKAEKITGESVPLMRKTDLHAEMVVLTAQGQAEKTMKKV